MSLPVSKSQNFLYIPLPERPESEDHDEMQKWKYQHKEGKEN
jgi:hypothetical protein